MSGSERTLKTPSAVKKGLKEIKFNKEKIAALQKRRKASAGSQTRGWRWQRKIWSRSWQGWQTNKVVEAYTSVGGDAGKADTERKEGEAGVRRTLDYWPASGSTQFVGVRDAADVASEVVVQWDSNQAVAGNSQ